MGQRWRAITNSLAEDVLKADEEARNAIKDYLPEAFADGFNLACYQMATSIGDAYLQGAFTLLDKNAVMYIVKENPDLLPQLRPNSPTAQKIRDGEILRWNKQKINAEVTQGIIQGESIPKIASRMENVVGMEERSALRNARTATNGAHNAGKENSFKEAQKLGIDIEQMWLATLDDRTRVNHRLLDGQVKPIGEKFECTHKGVKYEIEYPCDPTAKPEMVYNCRCTLVPYLPKFDNKVELSDRNTSKMTQASYEEWKRSQPVYKTSKGNSSKNTKKPQENTSKAVIKASNRQEAKELLHQIGFGRVNGTEKMSEKLLVDNANRLAELNNRFGAIPDGMALSVEKFTGTMSGSSAFVEFPVKKEGAKCLHLNSSVYRQTSRQVDMVAKNTRQSRWGVGYQMPVANDQRDVAVITHEYGHILENSLFNRGGIYRREGIKTTSKAYQKASADAFDDIIRIAQNNNPDFDFDKVMSRYGKSNTAEFFAECFMNSQCGKPNELGLAMEEWLKRKGF